MSAREELIAIQRELVERIKTEIYESLGPPSPELAAYYEQYKALFRGHHDPVAEADVVDAVSQANVVYFGDYHTLRESQKAPLRILRQALRSGREVVLATEVVHLIHQDHLDNFLADKISETEFLERIEYDTTWGFPWRNYRLQFEFAREHGIPMLAINSDPSIVKNSLTFRDAMAAMVLVEAMVRNPDRLVAVMFGDLHVAPEHLPAQVEHFAARRRVPPRRSVIVCQNSETVYWSLASRRLEQETHAVRVQPNLFCLINTTPLTKFQSYLNWEMNMEELEESVGLDQGPTLSASIMTDQVHDLMQTIHEFLQLPEVSLDDFTVHTSRDLDFLERLQHDAHYSPEELDEIRQQIARNESYFIIREKLIYLGNLSLDHAAEEATHYLNTKLAGHVLTPPDRRFDFYYRTLKEALGFVGSRVVNHKRTCFHRTDFEQVLEECRGRRLQGEMKLVRDIGRDALRHWEFEERWVRQPRPGYPRFRAIYERELMMHLGIVHALGYALGDRIYDALVADRIDRQPVKELFLERFEGPDRPREVYFECIQWLHDAET